MSLLSTFVQRNIGNYYASLNYVSTLTLRNVFRHILVTLRNDYHALIAREIITQYIRKVMQALLNYANITLKLRNGLMVLRKQYAIITEYHAQMRKTF